MTRILFVEDNCDQREMLPLLLRQGGGNYEIETAGGAAEAMQLVAERPFDCYILDMRMPDISGDQLCRWLRDAGSESPVIFLSSATEEDDKRAGFAAGASVYLAKPEELGNLASTVAVLLSRRERQLGEGERSGPVPPVSHCSTVDLSSSNA